jgi:hypothetical protein
VIRRIASNRKATTDRRHLKDVTAFLPTDHWHGGARCIHHPVEAGVHDSLEVLCTHLLERRKLQSGEIKDLLGIVERGLADSKVEALSTDLRFIAAFSAALTVATTALRTSGHRTAT